jgi:hypothetical protein
MIYIYQPRFLGDIIFTIAIAQKLSKDGEDVSFVVDESYLKEVSIKGYFPEINFISTQHFTFSEKKAGIYYLGNDTIINLLDTSFSFRHMMEKYKISQLPMKTWRELKITRNKSSETRLIKFLGLDSGEKFNLINEYYSNKKTDFLLPKIENNFKNIYLDKIDGFSLFDWMGVIEKAESIHTVHTSIQYLIDILPNTTADLHIYPRVEIFEPHSYYNYLFSKNYIYHKHPTNFYYVIEYRARMTKRFFLKMLSKLFSI